MQATEAKKCPICRGLNDGGPRHYGSYPYSALNPCPNPYHYGGGVMGKRYQRQEQWARVARLSTRLFGDADSLVLAVTGALWLAATVAWAIVGL